MSSARPLASAALVVAALLVPVAVRAQPADAADPVVLVVDGEADRVGVSELVSELERALGRSIVRPTDPAAH